MVDPIICIINGWVLSILWGWFMVPTLGLPVLTVAPAIGIALTVGYLTKSHNMKVMDIDNPKEVFDGFIGAVFGGFFTPLVALVTGWIVSFFM
jgi:hypothetical protein